MALLIYRRIFVAQTSSTNNMKNVFKFNLTQTLPIPGDHLNQITIDFLGNCDLLNDENGTFADNTRVWFCINRTISTPISAWQRIPLRPGNNGSSSTIEFRNALEIYELETDTTGQNDIEILKRLNEPF